MHRQILFEDVTKTIDQVAGSTVKSRTNVAERLAEVVARSLTIRHMFRAATSEMSSEARWPQVWFCRAYVDAARKALSRRLAKTFCRFRHAYYTSGRSTGGCSDPNDPFETAIHRW